MILTPVWAAYRAPCRPFDTGCRQCGKAIRASRAYCSEDCSDTFQENHFWNTARFAAIRRSAVVDAEAVRRLGLDNCAICARCGGPARAVAWPETVENGRVFAASYWSPEVNHKVPLNGVRPPFGCCHHLDNLECVCHPCHVAIGIEQRRAGLIGTRKPQIVLPMEASWLS